MDLTAGQVHGPVRIVSPLGAGGMGEVYRAHDAELKRDVALKILPAHVSRDVERLARFEREARVLASLNHPHIATIYGVDETDGVRALILELVEGPTLAERLGGGPLPVREALSAARQIAEALDAAHEKGIVHRDLKPANIKVTPDGIVKVLDFGIAKMRAPDEAAVEASTVPTVGTRAGALLGTAAYMSPEQARAQAVDKRSDIWAFGCVLYQMLNGRAAFAGETVFDTLAHVLEHEPAWDMLPPGARPRFAGFYTVVSRRSRRNACATSATRGSIWTNGRVSRPSCPEPGCWAPGARLRSGLLSVWRLPPLSLGPLVGF